MKKIKCYKYVWYTGCMIFGLLGMSNLFALEQWNKYSGWNEPSKILGIILLTSAIVVYKYIDKNCNQIKTVKCLKCGEVFFDTTDSKCPICDSKLIDVDVYYKK